MSLVRWEPARELSSLQGEVNRLFNSFFDTPAPTRSHGMTQRWMPAMDLVEEDDHYVLRADLPGMKAEDVSIELDQNVLSISGERKHEAKEGTQGGFYRIERASGAFRRMLTLPDGIDAEEIQAGFHDGVLEVSVPKPVAPEPKKVQIGGSADRPQTLEATAAGNGGSSG